MTAAEIKDRDSVWERIQREEPTFLQAYDPTNNYHTVREIVLGGSTTWGYTNAHYKAQPGHRVMDVGANVGIFSAWAASRGADVTAYECDPSVLPILTEAVKDLNVGVCWEAVRSTEEPLRYFGHLGYIGDVPFYNGAVEGMVPWAKAEEDRAVMVHATTFTEALGDEPWDMVKIDIEGGEVDILLHTPEEKLLQMKRAYVELHPWVSEPDYRAVLELCSRLWACTPLGTTPEGRFDAVYLEAK